MIKTFEFGDRIKKIREKALSRRQLYTRPIEVKTLHHIQGMYYYPLRKKATISYIEKGGQTATIIDIENVRRITLPRILNLPFYSMDIEPDFVGFTFALSLATTENLIVCADVVTIPEGIIREGPITEMSPKEIKLYDCRLLSQ